MIGLYFVQYNLGGRPGLKFDTNDIETRRSMFAYICNI
jgi:hypothetical protein